MSFSIYTLNSIGSPCQFPLRTSVSGWSKNFDTTVPSVLRITGSDERKYALISSREGAYVRWNTKEYFVPVERLQTGVWFIETSMTITNAFYITLRNTPFHVCTTINAEHKAVVLPGSTLGLSPLIELFAHLDLINELARGSLNINETLRYFREHYTKLFTP